MSLPEITKEQRNEVFVAGIPKSVTRDGLLKVFGQFGPLLKSTRLEARADHEHNIAHVVFQSGADVSKLLAAKGKLTLFGKPPGQLQIRLSDAAKKWRESMPDFQTESEESSVSDGFDNSITLPDLVDTTKKGSRSVKSGSDSGWQSVPLKTAKKTTVVRSVTKESPSSIYFWPDVDKNRIVDNTGFLRSFQPFYQVFIGNVSRKYTAAKFAEFLRPFGAIHRVEVRYKEHYKTAVAIVELGDCATFEKLLKLQTIRDRSSEPPVDLSVSVSRDAQNSLTVMVIGAFTHGDGPAILELFKPYGWIETPVGVKLGRRRDVSQAFIRFCHPNSFYAVANKLSEGRMSFRGEQLLVKVYELSERDKEFAEGRIKPPKGDTADIWVSPLAKNGRKIETVKTVVKAVTTASGSPLSLSSANNCSSSSTSSLNSLASSSVKSSQAEPGALSSQVKTEPPLQRVLPGSLFATPAQVTSTAKSLPQAPQAGYFDSLLGKHLHLDKNANMLGGVVTPIFSNSTQKPIGDHLSKKSGQTVVAPIAMRLLSQEATETGDTGFDNNGVIAADTAPVFSGGLQSEPHSAPILVGGRGIGTLLRVPSIAFNKNVVWLRNVKSVSSPELLNYFFRNTRSSTDGRATVIVCSTGNLAILELTDENVASRIAGRGQFSLEGHSVYASPPTEISKQHFALVNLSPALSQDTLDSLINFFEARIKQDSLKQYTRLNASRTTMVFGFPGQFDFCKLLSDVNDLERQWPLREGPAPSILCLSLPDAVVVSGWPTDGSLAVHEDTLLYTIEFLLQQPGAVRHIALNANAGRALVTFTNTKYVDQLGTKFPLTKTTMVNVTPYFDFVDDFWQ